MERQCCVPGCTEHLDVHLIPAQEKDKWLLKINETNKSPGGKPVDEDKLTGVCSLHFLCSDFVYSVDQNLEIRKELSASALPSIFPWSGGNWENVVINKSFMELTNSSSISINNDEISDEVFQGGVEIGNVESLGIELDEEENDEELTVMVSSIIPNVLVNNRIFFLLFL